jgi:membrane-bound lytic murein transglycosylase B
MDMMRRGLIALAVLSLTASTAAADPKFQQFVQELWPVAKAQGLSRAQFDAAIAGIDTPDPAVLKLAGNQPEFNSTTSQYLAKAVTPVRIETGKAMKAESAALLAKIERKYGVDRHILLAIWGMESNFGKDLGSMGVIRSLATLRYSGRKADYARNQLPAAFSILKRGIRSPANFTGSWAAAMGHTQFIPTSYLSSAVDWTGDGKKDIWGSHEDALASTANYLRNAGWRNDVPWGWEVTLPKDKATYIGRASKRSLAKWLELGVKPLAGKIPPSNAEAFVMIPQGLDGPRFLVVKDNFEALWSYNQSHSYGIAVGHLADRIRGMGPIATPWPDKDYGLSFKQRIELQNRLQQHGFNPGSRDGRFGARTFEAILGFQKKAKLGLDASPSLALLERLRQGP